MSSNIKLKKVIMTIVVCNADDYSECDALSRVIDLEGCNDIYDIKKGLTNLCGNIDVALKTLYELKDRPKIVCLCGSTKFKGAFEQQRWELTLRGDVVLSIGCYMHADNIEVSKEDKTALDALHKKKIEMADEILVLNVGGYIGESTKNEIEHAKKKGKVIKYLEAI